MKKKLIKWLGGLVVVILLLVLVAPAGVGMLAEGRYKQLWGDMLASEPGMQAEVTGFERGWYQSRAEVTLTISDATLAPMLLELGWGEADGDNALIRLREGVHHGPVPFTAPAPFWQRWRPGFAIVDSRLDENIPIIAEHGLDVVSTVHMGLTGRLNGFFEIAPFDVRNEGEQLRISTREPISAEWGSDRRFNRLDLRARVGELRIQGEPGVGIVLENPWLTINQRRGPSDIWLGGSELRLAAVETRLPGEGRTRLENLVWATSAGERNGLVDQEHEIRVEALRMDDFVAGPAALDVDLFNLHAESLSRLQEALSDWSAPDAEAMLDGEDVFAPLRGPILDLAMHQPGVRIKRLDIQLPGGAITGEGRVQLIELDARSLEEHLEAGQYLQLLDGEARIGAARDLARRALAMSLLGRLPEGELEDDLAELMDMQLAAAVAEGMLSETEDGYEIRLELRDGVLRINEREILRF